MKHRGRMTWGLAAAAAALMLVTPSARAASLPVTTCQAGLEVAVEKLHDSIYTGLEKCKDAIRQEVATGVLTGLGTNCTVSAGPPKVIGGCMSKAANTCEAALKAVYGASATLAPPAKPPIPTGAFGVFQTACQKLTAKGCNATTIGFNVTNNGSTLGHLVSGGLSTQAPAPPTSDPSGIQWTCDFLKFATEKYTIKQQLMTVPDMMSLFQDAIAAAHSSVTASTGPCATSGPCNTATNTCTGGTKGPCTTDADCGLACKSGTKHACATDTDCIKVSGAANQGTSCALPGNTNADLNVTRPNLCRFGVECRDHVCALDTTGVGAGQPCDGAVGVCDQSGAPCNINANKDECGPGNGPCDVPNCDPTLSANGSYLKASLTSGISLSIPVFGSLAMEVCRAGRSIGVCENDPHGAGSCLSDADCTDTCNSNLVCAGGSNNGTACTSSATCTGGGTCTGHAAGYGTCRGGSHPSCLSGSSPDDSLCNKCNLDPQEGLGAQFGTQSLVPSTAQVPSFLYLINQPSKTLLVNINTLPALVNGLLAAVCVSVTRSEGWCDCTGAGLPINLHTCDDHIVGGDCTGNGAPRSCCTSAHNGSNCTLDACGGPVTSANAEDSIYPGSIDGNISLAANGASVAGDCIDLVQVEFGAVGTTQDLGPDGLGCTPDDFSAPLPPLEFPITTGTADATLKDSPLTPGHCSLTTATACVQNVNCPAGETCVGAAFAANLTQTTNGSRITCAQMLSSNLADLGLGGAVPLAGLIPPSLGLGDVAAAFHFGCK